MNNYGLIDYTLGLDQQQYSEDYSWGEFFYDTALSNAVQVEVVYADARQNGVSLTAEQSARVEEKLDELRSYANAGNYRSLRQFLCSFYGPGATVSSYRAYLERCAVAEDYCQDRYYSFTFSSFITTIFNKNPDGKDRCEESFDHLGDLGHACQTWDRSGA